MIDDRLRAVTLDCQLCKGDGPPDCPDCRGAGEVPRVQGNLVLAYLGGSEDLRQLLVRVLQQVHIFEGKERRHNRLGDRLSETRLAHFRAGMIVVAQAIDAILERNTWQQPQGVARPRRGR